MQASEVSCRNHSDNARCVLAATPHDLAGAFPRVQRYTAAEVGAARRHLLRPGGQAGVAIHPWMDGRNRTPHSLQELAGDRHHAPSPFSAPTTLTVIVMIKGPRKRPTFLPLWPPLLLENHDYNSPFFWWAFRNRVRGAREHTHVRRSAPVSCRYLPSRGRGKNRAFSARHEENGTLYDGNASSSLRGRSIRTLYMGVGTKDELEPKREPELWPFPLTSLFGGILRGCGGRLESRGRSEEEYSFSWCLMNLYHLPNEASASGVFCRSCWFGYLSFPTAQKCQNRPKIGVRTQSFATQAELFARAHGA